jgi:Domain of unknown function (DUF3328).
MLRQVIMCNADTGTYGYKYVKGLEYRPYPDFSMPHKCRNFDAVLEWTNRAGSKVIHKIIRLSQERMRLSMATILDRLLIRWIS